MSIETLKQDHLDYMMPTYAPFDLVVDHGKGSICYNPLGDAYIDFSSGIGVNSLGFANDDWANAIAEQAKKVQHTSNLYYTAPAIELAKELCQHSPFAVAFFANSGTEANECAIKLARKYSFDRYGEGRAEIITLTDSFHGRTLASLSATGQSSMHTAFGPFCQGFRYVPAADENALKRAIGPATCAVMIECVQGEGGVHVLSSEYIQAVSQLCDENDLLLIIDEVQTGIGRTGKLFAFEHHHIEPDVITLAKGLGGGLPIGACLATAKLKSTMGLSTHGSTFGGNPVVCAGAKVVLQTINQADFLASVQTKADLFVTNLKAIDGIDEISHLGLMIGFTLKDKTPSDVLKSCLEKGLMVLTAKNKVRLLPPLTIEADDIIKGCAILKECIDA